MEDLFNTFRRTGEQFWGGQSEWMPSTEIFTRSDTRKGYTATPSKKPLPTTSEDN